MICNFKKLTLSLIFICLAVTCVLLSQVAFCQTSQNEKVKSREDIETIYKWNLEDIFSTPELWETTFQKANKKLIPAVASCKGKLNSVSDVLKCFQMNDEAGRAVEKLYVFSQMKHHENMSDNKNSDRANRAETLNTQYLASSSFIRTELLALPTKKLESYLKDPRLATYHFMIKQVIKMKPHTLSSKEEEMLAELRNVQASPEAIYQKLSTADMVFPSIVSPDGKNVQLSPSVYYEIMEDTVNRDYRKRAFEAYSSAYEKNKNSFAEVLNFQLNITSYVRKMRKYSSNLESSLDETFIPKIVYDNLVNSVQSQLKVLHRYNEIRRKALKLDKVHAYDAYIPLTKKFNSKFGFEEAKKINKAGLAFLGKDYVSILEKGFNERWIDVYETKNKKPGGYQWGSYDTHPYILMNYNGTFNEVLTLAHEMGHALHSFYTNSHQTYVNSNYSTFNAEVASTANEILVTKYLIKKAQTDDEKLFYVNSLVDTIRGTFFTQVMYSEFEKAIHAAADSGQPLSSDTYSSIWEALLKKYMGPSYEVDAGALISWAKIPHFYNSFYVYKYATSIAASYQIVKNMEGPQAAESQKNYLAFLSAGGSDYPVELLKKAGVDMTSMEPMQNLIKEFDRLLDEMEILLK